MHAGWCTRRSVLADTHPACGRQGYAPRPPMKITLTDESLLPVLLSFLRKERCVAYYEGGGIEAVRPHSFGAQESSELRAIVRRWWEENPEAQVEMSE